MRRDKKAPALYELVRGKTPMQRPPRRDSPAPIPNSTKREVSAPTAPRAEVKEDAGLAIFDWLSPGKIVKMPVGYMFFAGAAILAIVFAAYVAGYKKMETKSEAQRRAIVERDFENPVDPLIGLRLQNQAAGAAAQFTGTVAASPTQPMANAPRSIAQQKPAQTPAGLIEVTPGTPDPRQSGLNYLVAATLPPDEARKAGEFLVDRGLAVALVRVNNRSSRLEVQILRGISREQYRRGDLKLQIEEQVRSLGRTFARDHRGGDDFGSCWWKKFSG